MKSKANLQINGQERQPNRFWRWSKRGFKGLIGLTAGLMLAGAVYQLAATGMDDRKYQPPGRFVDVGGYRLHLHCTGEGSPTVVMDAGLGGGSLDWSAVQPEVSKFTRVCTYDRAGMGWSERAAAPRSARQIVAELHALLGNAGVRGPFVLVGHSLGGINMQLYASRYGEETAGLVLVDSSHENQLSRTEFRIPVFVPVLTKILSPFGVGRLINNASAANPRLPPGIDAARRAIYSHTGNMYTIADETSAIAESLEQLRAEPLNLGSKPLIVIARGSTEDSSASPEAAARTAQAWREFQTDLAARSTVGKLIIAGQSGHYVQFDQPGLVVDAIRRIVEAAGK